MLETTVNWVAGSKKAAVPVVVAGVLYVLSQLGVTGDMSVKEAVTLGVTAVAVWFARNRVKK